MKVYVATSGQWSDYSIDGVFLIKEKAELFASLHNGCVEEYDTLDEQISDKTIYSMYDCQYIPKIDCFEILKSCRYDRHGILDDEDIEECIPELYEHHPEKINKMGTTHEVFRLQFYSTKNYDRVKDIKKIKKIFFDKLMVYQAKEEGIN